MANFGWHTLKTQSASGNTFAFQSLFHWDSVTRVNNTVTINGANTVFRIVRTAGNWTSFNNSYHTDVRTEVPRGVLRQSTRVLNSGDYINVNQEYWGNVQYPSVTVGADQTSFEINHGFWNGGDYWAGGHFITFGALGAPAGTTYFSARTDTSLSVRNDVTNWGAYATAGSVRSYRADNSGFSGQTYLDTNDNAVVEHTGLTPNKEYWFRGWAYNGGGKSSYMSTITAVTLANSTVTSTNIESVAAQFVGTATTGKYTPSTKIQYREVGASAWEDSSSQSGGSFDIEVTGLSPSLSYEYRLVTTTTAGTWYGATTQFETLPAAKLIMPDGAVKNAVPYLIDGEGNAEMVKVKVL